MIPITETTRAAAGTSFDAIAASCIGKIFTSDRKSENPGN